MNGFYMIGCSIWAVVDFANAEKESNTNFLGLSSSYPAIVAIVGVSVITLAVICWTLTFFCTDCYNAEVDSSSHPACQSSGLGIALSSQVSQQDETLDLTNKYLHNPPNQQPQHLYQYHTPASNVPPQQYSNIANSSHCNNMCPSPSAPGIEPDVQGYHNYYQGHNSMQGYNHQSSLPPPPSYPGFS